MFGLALAQTVVTYQPAADVIDADASGTTPAQDAITSSLGSLGAYGGTKTLPPGVFRLTGPINPPGNHLTLCGSGRGATVLMVDDSLGNIGDVVTSEGVTGFTLRDLSFASATPRTAGATVKIKKGYGTIADNGLLAGATVQNVAFLHQYQSIVTSDSPPATSVADGAWLVWVDRVFIQFTSPGGTGVWLNSQWGGSNKLTNVYVAGQRWNGDTTRSLAALRVSGAGDLNVVNFTGLINDYGILIDPTSPSIAQAGEFVNVDIDTATNYCVSIAGTARVEWMKFANLGMWNPGVHGMYVNNTLARGISVTNSHATQGNGGGQFGFYVNAGKYVDFVNCETSDVRNGFGAAAGTDGVGFHGCRVLKNNFAAPTVGFYTYGDNTQAIGNKSQAVTLFDGTPDVDLGNLTLP